MSRAAESLKAEIRRRQARGMRPRTMKRIIEDLRTLGYRLGKDSCRSIARWMTGPDAGNTYPCDSREVFEIGTGLSAFHTAAKRDSNFKRLQEIRLSGEWYAVIRGYIVEI